MIASAGAAFRIAPIAVGEESTVIAEYEPDPAASERYQSEAELEKELIKQLCAQAYEPLAITSEVDLVANLRAQLEALNGITFTDTEWKAFFSEKIANANDGIVEKTALIQENHVQILNREDGSFENIALIDKTNVHNNRLQVINQYKSEGARATRYDVTILVNGLPMVHVELKRRGVDIREAFNQINRYQRDSFWVGSGLFEYVQLFVISNGTLTKYYSNTTRDRHVGELAGKRSRKKTSSSFEFTSWWADANNNRIADLPGFTRTFLSKRTLLNVLTRYCVFDVDRSLLVMRPYQIVATERILQRIEISTNYRRTGTIDAGGYVWHTTGSGKTLTSFKTAQLATCMEGIDKVLFVVDRKDLDYQTMREYERFEKGAANSNGSTAVLKEQLEGPDSRIIITTIQKLSTFVKRNKQHPVYGKHVVIVFDECHRSQFGDMHTAIAKTFKHYHLFGFTGTPIFADNAGTSGIPKRRTTAQAFGDKLHAYTIVDAIGDKNVLPFRIDYVNTIKVAPQATNKPVAAIDTESALLHPDRVRMVAEYILDRFDQKTRRGEGYVLKDKRVRGFNSMFATASIDAAKRYYNAIERLQRERAQAAQAAGKRYERLKVGLIYSFAPNEDEPDGLLGEEDFEPDGLDKASRDFLEDAVQDYNDMFGTSYDTSSTKFENYYKDLSGRLKNRELDLVIVVNMFLTGFDATTLNTLWVDKNLKQHGLIQAFSRTNRILNSVKTYGNIVCFRDLEDEVDDALALFGNKDAASVVKIAPYGEYYSKYQQKISDLLDRFPLGKEIVGEQAQKDFIALFGAILGLRNILVAFDEFAGNEILTPRQMQDYQSIYLDLYEDFRRTAEGDKESISEDVVFEIELVKQIEVGVDYILMLVSEYQKQKGNGVDKELEARSNIARALEASASLRNKKDLVMEFVDSISADINTVHAWQAYIAQKKHDELERIIAEENLKPGPARAFVEDAFRNGEIPTGGTAITKILPPVSRFAHGNNHGTKKAVVLEKLKAFFDRFSGLS
ncbi:type I restriction enzyme R subunit [Kitasatospora sp. GP30]|uniref:type I restriction endonuclease subunit R n=1 Tax=Kitasatospora sp. GP30 TaxID=3035084 RepID=UPI000C70FA4E|nr:type I restriction endonuclease subunit R [Kitasatospora sp. GP30]MDH6138336.1 type I restriction enzyme R subunit [Kitasatospora sp. GP30]